MLTPFAKHLGIKSAGLAVAGVLLAVGLVWFCLPLAPYLDDGPFHGTPIAPLEGQPPDQSLSIYSGFVLEVYDPVADGESPIVQLRDSADHVRWAIRADGFESGDVREIRFMEADRGLARSGTITGGVQWTYGHELTRWYITGNGELRDYWYSW